MKRINKENVENFWYYNKWFVLGGALFLALAINLISTVVNNKPAAFSGILLNCTQREQSSALEAGFAAYAKIDTEEDGAVTLDSGFSVTDAASEQNIQTLQVVAARIAAQDVDVLAADAESFLLYGYNTGEMFSDLRELLSAKQLAELEGKLFYIDGAVEAYIQEHRDDVDAVEAVEFPDPLVPENMQEPIPVGIRVDSCEVFSQSYSSGGAATYLGIVSNAPHPELSALLIEYLYGAA